MWESVDVLIKSSSHRAHSPGKHLLWQETLTSEGEREKEREILGREI